jgi:hypothetical protein
MSGTPVPTIALRAYQLWEAAGRPEGRSEEFYFQAEEELRSLLERELQSEFPIDKTAPSNDPQQ